MWKWCFKVNENVQNDWLVRKLLVGTFYPGRPIKNNIKLHFLNKKEMDEMVLFRNASLQSQNTWERLAIKKPRLWWWWSSRQHADRVRIPLKSSVFFFEKNENIEAGIGPYLVIRSYLIQSNFVLRTQLKLIPIWNDLDRGGG